jgi:hypothetical protein
LWRDLNISQGSLDVGVTHQLHKRGQANPSAHHVRGEGVPETVRMSDLNAGALTMVAEQRS